ncbi:MFS transporter [Roseomonas frigidaquae]|uniref:MFS transporter n=1 Tax=Falsiroseomonas frigidaquae TaxID=487318 RepID=A0ABX1EVP7_9PROT|nr:MFS transporter [Falsiroseomonas frigidaquae]NKE43205.1 MFS transporter [Falsiroseomonas frigidaquae]
MSSITALNALNFFMADVRDGLGPFLGVFLQQQGWQPAAIGLVMTLGGIAGMAATTPLGLLVDATRHKRALIVIAAIAIIAACTINYFAPLFAVTAVAQAVAGIGGALVVPCIAAITLGLVRQKGYAHQLGRNEAFNHAGNASAAALAGLFGWWFGLVAVFVLMAVMALGAVLAVLLIRPGEIDHAAARGLTAKAPEPLLPTLFGTHALLLLAITLMLFHLANAAMLPLLGQAMVARDPTVDPAGYTAATVILAQVTMIPMALLAARLATRRGYWVVFVLALAALPLRGMLAGFVVHPLVLVPVQMLDGVGAGMLGVAVPGLVSRILDGSGHVTAGLAAVMTLQGVGAALSATLGGLVAQHYGYGAAFLVLGGVAAAALLLWLAASSILRPAGAVQAA